MPVAAPCAPCVVRAIPAKGRAAADAEVGREHEESAPHEPFSDSRGVPTPAVEPATVPVTPSPRGWIVTAGRPRAPASPSLRMHISRSGATVALSLVAGLLGAQESDRVVVHGFLTQGAGISRDRQLLGIGRDGTTDYRTAALQVRGRLSESRSIVVQLSHKRVGTSVVNEAQQDVALNWAFFQQDIGTGYLRVGRFAMPRGIYNEIRPVGVLLPFFRAPYNLYTEGVEVIDGIGAQQTINAATRWSTQFSAYAGGWDFRQVNFNVANGRPVLYSQRVDRAVGGQVWQKFPIEGLRIGYGAQLFSAANLPFSADSGRGTGWQGQASFDWTHRLVAVRAEAVRFGSGTFRYDAWMAQLGIKPTEKLSFWLQTDNGDYRSTFAPLPSVRFPTGTIRFARTNGASISYAWTPQFVTRFEAHRNRGFNFDEFVAPFAPGPTGLRQLSPASGTSFLASVAVSF